MGAEQTKVTSYYGLIIKLLSHLLVALSAMVIEYWVGELMAAVRNCPSLGLSLYGTQ